MTNNIATEAKPHGSRVLNAWRAEQEAKRSGVSAQAENSVTDGIQLSELASLLGASHLTSSGAVVTKDTAMRVSAVYGCVSLIAGAIATLPLGIYERNASDRMKADHDYWWMFNERACDQYTSAAAWEYVMSAKLFHGDGFAEWLRPSRSSNRVIGWEPLHPDWVYPFRDKKRVYYRITKPGEASYTLDSADMMHIPSLGFDGLRSPSAITYAAREAIGTALAGQNFNGKFFANGAQFDYALATDATLNEEQIGLLKASLAARAQSGGRSPLLLTGGIKPANLSINSKDAEILATRLFTVEDICRFLGVPPHMVGHTDKTTSWGSGIESQGIGFVRYTLQRHLTPIAQECNSKLWPVRQKYFVEHITAALERGDLKSRYEAYRIGMGRAGEQPWLSSDEVRRLENMAPNPDLSINGAANAQPPATATQ